MCKPSWLLLFAAALVPPARTQAPAQATTQGVTPSPFTLIPQSPSALSPGAVMLVELEGRFAQAVEAGGGKAFATWFAEDAVILNNGQPALQGRGAIALAANWDPRDYTLTWVAQGAQMSPSNDMGFTWGHYEGRSKNLKGAVVANAGRYITIWKKMTDGSWKVALDASADEPPASTPGGAATNPR